jgi:asparagine synthetase B (glutamine-hydrolysing)
LLREEFEVERSRRRIERGMTNLPPFAESMPTEVPDDDWVLSVSIDHPGRELAGSARCAEQGPVRCFFDGLLFDREHLMDPTDRDQPDCSDAALVLRAYEREGEGALCRLRGSFVVAIIDGSRDLAIVARDQLGSHPLFYAEAGSRVLFASAAQSLLQQPGVSRALNRAAIADHLCFRYPDLHETFFAAVRRLPPGWQAVISGGRLRLNRYWDPCGDDPIQWLTTEEIDRFDEVFGRAVDRCLGHGPTGIYLSGGFDSISVAAVATDRARQIGLDPPWALSLGFPDPACDERVVQAAVAKELGLRQVLLDMHEALGFRPLLEQALQLNMTLSAPLINTWQPAYLTLAKRVRPHGVRTILTGHGGDEWLTVSPYLAADLMRRGALVELFQFLRTVKRSFARGPFVRKTLLKFGVRPLASLTIDRFFRSAHDANRLKRILGRDPIWVAPDRELRAEQRRRAEIVLSSSTVPQQGFYFQDMRSSLDHPLVSWESEEQFQLGKQIGVRFLHPFTDVDLVEMLYRTPPRVLNQGGRTKGLVRGTVARRFPALGFEGHRKVAATSFYQSVILNEGPALANAAIEFPALSRLGVVDGPAASAAVAEGFKQRNNVFLRFFLILGLEMWARHHVN